VALSQYSDGIELKPLLNFFTFFTLFFIVFAFVQLPEITRKNRHERSFN